jgi:hypothetical protein
MDRALPIHAGGVLTKWKFRKRKEKMNVIVRRILGVSIAVLGMGMSVQAAPFTGGNLVIYRIGDGVNPLSSTGSVVFVDEYTTNGTLVQSVELPTTQTGSNYPFVSSGTASSEGGLSLSEDGQYLFLQGYATNTSYNGTSLASSLSTVVPRVVARVDYNGNTDTSTVLSNWVTANNPRSAVSSDGISIWIGGAGSGIGYTTLGSNNFIFLNGFTGSTSNKPTNTERLGIFGGQLYASTAKTTNGIYMVGIGLPTTTNQAVVILNGAPGNGVSGPGTGNPFHFVFLPLQNGTNLDTLYYADDAGANDATGIYKYSLVGTTWAFNGSIPVSDPNPNDVGPCGLTAAIQISGSTTSVVLYATSGGSTAVGGGSLFVATDTAGYNIAPSGFATTIATASANTAFRDIAFAPVAFRNLSVAKVGNDMNIAWSTTGGKSYALQATAGGVGGSYSANAAFADISPTILLPGGTPQTNYVDVGGATNWTARFYRARQLP